jgi:AraC-like DNA-binding protein
MAIYAFMPQASMHIFLAGFHDILKTMLYENNFQNSEELNEVNVSCCLYRTEQARGFPAHCHSFFELEYSIKGDRLASLNGKRFTLPEGSLYFVPLLSVHSTTNIKSFTENIIIQFTREFLYTNAKSLPRKAIVMPAGELLENGYILPAEHSRLEECLQRLAQACPLHSVNDLDVDERISQDEVPEGKISKKVYPDFVFPFNYTPAVEWKINGLTMELISLLFEQGFLRIELNIGNPMDTLRMQPVLNLLIAQPEIQMDLHKAAEIACMSYSNFSRTFKQLIGHNYVDYCNISRVRRAEEMLEAPSKLSVTEISQQLNFGSINYFNRIFKKYNGNTPTNYRKMMRT